MNLEASNEALRLLADKNYDPSCLQSELGVSDNRYVGVLVGLLDVDPKLVKNRAAKLIARLAEAKPDALYTRRERLAGMLAGKQTILQWNALIAVGHLAGVADDPWVEELLPLLFQFLREESMITAAHAVAALGRIAMAKARLREEIVGQLLEVNSVPRDPACAAILAGKVMTALTPLCGELGPAGSVAVRGYGTEHLASPHAPTRREAEKMIACLKKME